MDKAHDYRSLWKDQQQRISDLGHSLTDEQWSAASLCDGWRVGDVFGHMTVGFATPLAVVLVKIAKKRGNVNAASAVTSAQLASSKTRQELMSLYDSARAHPKGVGRILKPRDGVADNTIHEMDIRRPLGIDHPFSPAAMAAALDALCHSKSPLFAPAKTAKGFDLYATDIEWGRPTAGGPFIEGPSEDLALALAGRPIGLQTLRGDGVSELARRIGAAAPADAVL
jgi:uncharacterized protein (TIGR03083 family)